MKPYAYVVALALLSLASCAGDDELSDPNEQDNSPSTTTDALYAVHSDGLQSTWSEGDSIAIVCEGNRSIAVAEAGGRTVTIPRSVTGTTTASSLFAATPAARLVTADATSLTVSIPTAQAVTSDGYDPQAAISVAHSSTDTLAFRSVVGGLRLNFSLSGVSKLEIESVDGYALAGSARLTWNEDGTFVAQPQADSAYILTVTPADGTTFQTGRDYFVSTLPCNVYGGYRLSIYKDGEVAHYFGVHQTFDRALYISPLDLVESGLEFDDPDAPLVEEERPELDATTSALVRQYKQNPTDENYQALMDQMGLRYDKVVARKKSKLRELERDAKTQGVIDEMQEIVDEMVNNREVRLYQQFLRLIDPRTYDNPNDAWLVLRGSSAPNAYIGYAPVTNAEYAAFKSGFTYASGQDNYPVTSVSIADATAYCDYLTALDPTHHYRLPSDEEWVLAAGHMPKDVTMNAGHVESGLTAVDAYKQTTGASGGIDFWGNCWEWTSTTDASGLYVVKGGAWDSDRDDCRSEKSDVTRNGSHGYSNVGFRVVREDLSTAATRRLRR